MIGDYYHWFTLLCIKLKSDQMNTGTKNYLKEDLWVDGLQTQVKLKNKCIKLTNVLVQSLGV